MVKIIKLNYDGDLDETNLSIKDRKYKFQLVKESLNIDDTNFKEQHEWDIGKMGIIKILGKNNCDKEEENIHQLPIKYDYQYFGDLYVIMVNNNLIQDLDIENFECIYNALYSDPEFFLNDSDRSDEEKDIEDIDEDELNNEQEYYNIDDDLVDDENLVMDNYGDDSTDNESVVGVEEKKKRKKKIIKIIETRDILYEETCIKENIVDTLRHKSLDILKKTGIICLSETFVKELEMEIFNYSLRQALKKKIVPTWNTHVKKIYINKLRSLYINFDPNSYIKNKRLIERIKKNEFTAKKLVNLTPHELFPENWKEMIDEKFKRNKVLYHTKKEAMTDQFKCKKCKSRETCYYEMQTRSADEPMTIFITCLNCGNRWKN